VLALAAVVAGDGRRGALALVAGALVAAAVVALARRRLGGFTGDVAGAAGILLETVGLLVVAARW
jgi:adenosylcobinamide-GDP ribazoletransferase